MSVRLVRSIVTVSTIGLIGLSAVGGYALATETLSGEQQLLLVGLFGCLGLVALVGTHRSNIAIKHLETQAAWRAHQEFESLYERSPIPYMSVGTAGQILRANPAAVHLLGETIDTITSRTWFQFLDVSVMTDAMSTLKSKVAGGLTINDEVVPVLRTTGERRWVSFNIYSSPQGRKERLIELVDVTDKRAVDTAKSEFVALATHQLRTPIAAIRWNVELLERATRDTVTDKQQRYLDKISRNVMRMIHLIDDFLSVSKLEMGTFAAEPVEVELSSYLASIRAEFEEKIVTKQLNCICAVSPEQLYVMVDERLFHIIVSNLFSNAVKYTPAAGEVTVEAEVIDRDLHLVCRDSGIGIPEAEQASLFTKFYRSSNAKQQVTEGTGLGLYVVKQSVELLGGTIEYESTQDVGTTFTVTLPGVVR